MRRAGDDEADIKASIAEYAQAATNAVQADSMASSFTVPMAICSSSSSAEFEPALRSLRRHDRESLAVRARSGRCGQQRDRQGQGRIRLSPFGVFNDMPVYPAMESDYTYLAAQLNARGCSTSIWWITRRWEHRRFRNRSGDAARPVALRADPVRRLRRSRAENDLAADKCDLVAVDAAARQSGPDQTLETGASLNAPDPATFYTPGPRVIRIIDAALMVTLYLVTHGQPRLTAREVRATLPRLFTRWRADAIILGISSAPPFTTR